MLTSLKVSHKLLMIYALDMVAVVFLGFSLVDEKYLAINFARRELDGLEIIGAARQSLFATLGYDAALRGGEPLAVAGSARDYEARLAELTRLGRTLGEGMEVAAPIRAVIDEPLRRPADREAAIAGLRTVIARVGDMSNLILDPDLDSYYTMSLVVLRFPDLIETLARLDQQLGAIDRDGPPDSERRLDLLLAEGKLATILQGIENDLAAGLRGNADGSLQAALQPSCDALAAAVARTNTAIRAELVAGSGESRLAIGASLDATATAWEAASLELDRLLRLRIDGYFQRMIRQFAAAAALLTLILLVVLVVARRISRPLSELATLADRLRLSGDYSLRSTWNSGDEIGTLAKAFNRMIEGLEAGDEAKRLLKELETAQARLIENNTALEKANRLVLDSIGYARKIQDGLLPDASTLGDAVLEFHVSWNPLQQVGGDYYWLHRVGRRATVLLADCTGHGVPGAFMTVVVATALDRILVEGGDLPPSEILCRLDKAVRERLRQDRADGLSDDGLDAAVCQWDGETRTLTFAGANLPLVICTDGQVRTVKGSRHSLGYRTGTAPSAFDDHVLPVEPGTAVYMFTDGMTDHVGGEPPRLFGRRRLLELITATADLPLYRQVDRIEQALAEHRGTQHRRDDMTIVAFRPF